jgi:transposase
LAQWYQARTAGAKTGLRKAMIVALARKLLIDLWRYVTIGKARTVPSCVRRHERL